MFELLFYGFLTFYKHVGGENSKMTDQEDSYQILIQAVQPADGIVGSACVQMIWGKTAGVFSIGVERSPVGDRDEQPSDRRDTLHHGRYSQVACPPHLH